MNTCKDCQELIDDSVKRLGKRPVKKYLCKKRSKTRKADDPVCMLFIKKEKECERGKRTQNY